MDITAERTLEYNDGRTIRPVAVRIYRPEQRGRHRTRHWTCRVQWDGLDVPAYETFGADSAEALMNALDSVGVEVKRHEGLRWPEKSEESNSTEPGRKRNPWPIDRGPAWLPVPDPLPPDVIIERMLAAPGSDQLTVRVAVYKPQPRAAGEWVCHYEILDPTPLGHNRKWRAHGADSAQALFLALHSIKVDVELFGLTHRGDNPWEVHVEAPVPEPPERAAESG